MEFSDIFNSKFLQNPIFANLNNELRNLDINAILSDEMSIVCGDFYGIQSFIFDGLGAKNAAKVIRAKSAFVQIFTQIIAEYIARDGGLILSTNAGKFEILIHKKLEHIKYQIKHIQSQIDEFFIDNFYGLSGMNLVAFSCKEDDFKSPIKYQEMRSNIAKEIEKKKFNKFTLQTRSKVVLNYDNSITNQTLCPICNTRKIAINNHQCDICDAFINLGKALTDKNTKSISAQKLHINFVGDISIDLDDKIRSYVASKDGVIKSFEELCSNDFNAIGGFKADVDGMGAFIQNSSIKDSYLNFNMFAKNIDSFFSLYIPQIIQNEFKDSYVVFAGGDDLFIIGQWQSTLDLARRIRAEFIDFVKSKELSISFGIALFKPSRPVNYLAHHLEELLKNSKNIDGKNSITLFNSSVKWSEYIEIFDELSTLMGDLGDDDKMAFFYRILDICDMSSRLQSKFSPQDALWRSKLNYSYNRNIKSKDENILQSLNKNIAKSPKAVKMVVSELIYKRRENG